MHSGIFIPWNFNGSGIDLSSSFPGKSLSGCGASKGEGQSFLSTLIAVTGDKNVSQLKCFQLTQLGKNGNTNKALGLMGLNSLGIELQKGELSLDDNFLPLRAFMELGENLSAPYGNNTSRDPSIEQGDLVPNNAHRADFDKPEALKSTEETNPNGKIHLAELLKVLESVFSRPEGKACLYNRTPDSSTEQANLIPEKVHGLDFERPEAVISTGETNPKGKIHLAYLLKALGAGSSKLEGRACLYNPIPDSLMEQKALISEKICGLGFQKPEAGISEGRTNSGEKIHLAELLKSWGVDLAEAEKEDQTSGEESGKKSVNKDEKAQVGGKTVLNSEAQEGENIKGAGKGSAVEGATVRMKYEPQNTKGMIIESGNLDQDFVNSHSDRAGSDKGQDALLLSNNQPSAKAGGVLGQAEQIEPFQRQFQTEVVTQIVKRAVLNVKDGHTEIKIELKPEFLGHIRMHVATENQQVMVRMLTELPLVKDIIENNIYQLKADLQNQGLEVDKFEVFVSRDSEQFVGGRENTEFQEARSQSEEKEDFEETPAEELEETIQLTEKCGGTTLIGVFA